MNILPFVFTFLLLLTLLTSFMFTSSLRIKRGKEVIVKQHQAYLSLLSKQNKDRFDKIRSSKKGKTPPPPPDNKKEAPPTAEGTQERQAKVAKKTEQDYRDVRMGYEASKINLWPMIHGENPILRSMLQKTLARLIQILYEPYSFYKTNSKKDIAWEIAQAMIDQKIEAFEKLQFKDSDLGNIYYNIIKGTNTGYPSLTEYCRLDHKDSKPPIHFRFTSKPVIRAAIGERLAEQVFDLERKNQAKNSKTHVLTKQEFLDLAKIHPSPDVPYDLLEELFYFTNSNKGFPQISFKQNVKIRAFHEAKNGEKQS